MAVRATRLEIGKFLALQLIAFVVLALIVNVALQFIGLRLSSGTDWVWSGALIYMLVLGGYMPVALELQDGQLVATLGFIGRKRIPVETIRVIASSRFPVAGVTIRYGRWGVLLMPRVAGLDALLVALRVANPAIEVSPPASR